MSQISHEPEKKKGERERERERESWGGEVRGVKEWDKCLSSLMPVNAAQTATRRSASLKPYFSPNRQLLLELTWWSLRYHSDSEKLNLNDGWFHTVECFSTSHGLSLIIVFQVTSPTLFLYPSCSKPNTDNSPFISHNSFAFTRAH